MKILIISDVHGNLPALEFVLKLEKNADFIISLGDVVNYGPWSNECVDVLENLTDKILIKGNHEEAFISGNYPGNNHIAKTFFDFCYPNFDKKNIISRYVQKYNFGDFDFEHTLNNKYIFPDTELALKKNIFIGHSHRLFSKKINEYKLINVGSVGQNRNNVDELNYVIWETERNNIQLVTKNFSADRLIKEMKQKKYPEICVEYIQSKRSNKV